MKQVRDMIRKYGFKDIKFKTGVLDPEVEIETVKQLYRAFPGVPHDTSLGAMVALAGELRRHAAACDEAGHPIDLFRVLEPAFLTAATETSRARQLTAPIPKLCTLVVASPFDAAIHDAFGKVHGRSVYDTYGPDLMKRDLGHYLGAGFAGERLDRYLRRRPPERIRGPRCVPVGGTPSLL